MIVTTSISLPIINFCSNGALPPPYRKYFCKGHVTALPKQNGGLRPITVNLLLWCLISQILEHKACPLVRSYLLPHQMGVGVKCGTEAVIMPSTAYLTAWSFKTTFFYKLTLTTRLAVSLARISSTLFELMPLALPDGSITATATKISFYLVLSLFSVPSALNKVTR